MSKLSTKEELSLLLIQDKNAFLEALIDEKVERNKETREFVLNMNDPESAFYYSCYIDQEPSADMRKICCQEAAWACDYSIIMDIEPRSDTRTASCREPICAFYYAIRVDGGFTQETYDGVAKDPVWLKRYERYILEKRQ